MAITKIQNIVPCSSWSVQRVLSLVRLAIGELTNENIQDDNIRSYLNANISYIYNMILGVEADDDYGVRLIGNADTIKPLITIDLTLPAKDFISTHPNRNAMFGYVSLYDDNGHPFAEPANARDISDLTGNGLGDLNDGLADYDLLGFDVDGVFGIDKNGVRKPTLADQTVSITVDWHKHYTASNIINKINYIYLKSDDGTIYEPLRKAKLNEITQWSRRFNDIRVNEVFNEQSGAWCVFGNVIYIYIGSELLSYFIDLTDDTKTETEQRNPLFEIFGIRHPLSDNMLPTNNRDSGYWQTIDIPDMYIRLLVLLTQKSCLEQLKREVDVNLEQVINQTSQGLLQGKMIENKLEVQQ
jgi:hypothetical protein